MRYRIWLPLLFAAMSGPLSAQQPAPQAVPVTTVVAEAKPVRQSKDFVGRIEAIQRVEVRARVTGYLEAVCTAATAHPHAGLFQELLRLQRERHMARQLRFGKAFLVNRPDGGDELRIALGQLINQIAPP